MDNLSKKIPEIQTAEDCEKIPWEDSVVWAETGAGGQKLWRWIDKKHVQYITWTNGNVSVTPDNISMLSSVLRSVVIQGAVVFVGKNVNVG